MLHPYVSRRNTGIIMNGICNDRVYANDVRVESVLKELVLDNK